MRSGVGVLTACLLLSGCLGGGTSGDATTFSVHSEPVEGEPLDVLFRIEADGDATGLEWSLDAEGDGLPDAGGGTFPAEVVHSFPRPGNYTSLFIVSGDGVLRSQTLAVAVVGPEPLVLQGTSTVTSGPQKRTTGYVDCVGFRAGENGMDCVWFPLEGVDGWTFRAESDAAAPADLEFLTTCDPDTTSSLGIHVNGARGRVPEGAGCALMWAYGFSTGAITLTLTLSP